MIGRRGPTRSERVTRFRDGASNTDRDTLAVEEPLEIRVAWAEEGARRVEPLAVTMRTPGDDFELVAGFLHGEGLVRGAGDLKELIYCSGPEEQEYNVVEARLAPGRSVDVEALRRNFYTTSSCGVCGKASLDAVSAIGCARIASETAIDALAVNRFPERLLDRQRVFDRTGGLHAAGLFDTQGAPLVVMEDVGRHNAVDKVVGRTLLDRALPASERVLVVSGRASFELVQKAVAAGIPILVAVGAPSSLAVDLARRFDQTLIGFAREDGFNVYSGGWRVR